MATRAMPARIMMPTSLKQNGHGGRAPRDLTPGPGLQLRIALPDSPGQHSPRINVEHHVNVVAHDRVGVQARSEYFGSSSRRSSTPGADARTTDRIAAVYAAEKDAADEAADAVIGG